MPTPRLEYLASFVRLLGLSISKIEKGYSQCLLEVKEELQNVYPNAPGGILKLIHGGVISTLADTGMACALFSSLDENEVPRTLEIKVNYFVAATSGLLTCDSKIVHKDKKVAALESEITNDGRLIAKATATFSIVNAKGD